MVAKFRIPAEREFGWQLKPASSTEFEIVERSNGQFCVVLNHSLLRGVTSEMIYWWFQNFCNLTVTLKDIPGYKNKQVPGYLLWHPSDHCSATLSGELGPNGTARAGASIAIQEVMQYNTYGMDYPVDAVLKIFYCARDGWAMGKSLPLFGKVMCLRIHFKDVLENGDIIGVHYHYEVVIGASGNNALVRAINRKIAGNFSPEFFSAWHLHNVIEVGTFENFLPAVYSQRNLEDTLHYSLDMDSMAASHDQVSAYSPELFAGRVAGYKEARDPHEFQAAEAESFL